MEAPFLALLTDLGFSRFQEGFENDAAWGSLREPARASQATSQGITWTANTSGNTITTGDGPARTGDWGIYDPDHGSATGTPAQCDIDNPPDTCLFKDGFTGTRAAGESLMTAVGGYFQGSTQPNLRLILDEGTPISLGRLTSPDHQFFGVVDTTGFNSFRLEEVDGKVGNERLVFADRMPIENHLARHRLADVEDARDIGAHQPLELGPPDLGPLPAVEDRELLDDSLPLLRRHLVRSVDVTQLDGGEVLVLTNRNVREHRRPGVVAEDEPADRE